MLLVDHREATDEYLRRHPVALQIANGPIVRFDPDRHTIGISPASLHMLYRYVNSPPEDKWQV